MTRAPWLWLAALILGAACAHAQEPDLQPIFNGRDLSGWEVPEGNVWWSVKDGICTGQSDAKKTGSILWTRKTHKDFVMEFDFRMGTEGVIDSGVFLRTDHEQIQIGISGSLKRDMTASPYIPGKGYPVEADGVAELLKADDWNRMRIRAVGPAYRVWLNGKEVMNYTSETAVESGQIGLQLHPGRNMRIDFRAIRLATL